MKDISIQEVTAYIRSNIAKDLKVGQVAEHFGYSLSHFSREFKRELLCSASEYISAMKIEQSIKNLGKKDSVLKAQLAAGYLSSGTFSNFFTRFTGLSPKQFQTGIDSLYATLKAREEQGVEGSFYSLPENQTKAHPLSAHSCTVRITAPDTFKGIIFVGLFDKFLPNRKPIIGKALVQSRVCKFEDSIPPGDYYFLICAIERKPDPIDYFFLDAALRDGSRDPVYFPLESDREIHFTLREARTEDPPITINLPKLYIDGLNSGSLGH
jgi:AraC-like DNA-binding protein